MNSVRISSARGNTLHRNRSRKCRALWHGNERFHIIWIRLTSRKTRSDAKKENNRNQRKCCWEFHRSDVGQQPTSMWIIEIPGSRCCLEIWLRQTWQIQLLLTSPQSLLLHLPIFAFVHFYFTHSSASRWFQLPLENNGYSKPNGMINSLLRSERSNFQFHVSTDTDGGVALCSKSQYLNSIEYQTCNKDEMINLEDVCTIRLMTVATEPRLQSSRPETCLTNDCCRPNGTCTQSYVNWYTNKRTADDKWRLNGNSLIYSRTRYVTRYITKESMPM